MSVDVVGEAGFAEIDWSAGPYFIETGIDPSGGTDYTITGTSQLLSVPFALHAKTAETISGAIAEEDPVFIASPASGIEAADISNWDESYSWGDHAREDYLTVETDPLFTSAFASDVHDHVVAITEADGFMGSEDKARLDGIEDGAQVNVQPDWEELREYLGGTDLMGERLKSTRTEPDPHPRWDSPNVANNETGFSAFPGGERKEDGSFDWLGGQGFWWASTEYRIRTAHSHEGMWLFVSDETRSGYSVRCIKATGG